MNDEASNVLELPPELVGRATVNLHGAGAVVRVEAPKHCEGLSIEAYAGSKVLIERDCWIGSLSIHAGAGSDIRIGPGTGIGGLSILCHEPVKIDIGEACLISHEVSISASDMHSIIDLETGVRINAAKDIVIEDHVWVGTRATILKGVRIESWCVIGAGSVVTRSAPANSVLAGNPARVVRSGVKWDYSLI